MLSHNKTLAAQLYGELKSFFPNNAVEYFISYYDYYQPEAYVPTTDTYIEKDASINEDIDRLRLRATSSLMEREDVIIVATVSAIYGLGDPVEYRERMVTLTRGQTIAPRRDPARARAASSTRATTSRSSAAPSACAATRSRSSRRTRSRACASRCGATRSSGSPRSTRSPARRSPSWSARRSTRRSTSSPSRRRSSARSALIRAELAERLAELRNAREAARGAAARVAHELRHRDDARDRHVRRHRELLAPSLGPRGRRAPGVPVRLLPRGLPRRRRRVARHAAADRRDVQRRSRAQADARRVRVPPAERARQPAADVRRVPLAHAARALRVARRRATSSCSCPRVSSSSRSSAPRGSSIRRSRSAPCAARSTIC